ncbi:MAG: hypothetical protein CMK07_05155 [Ponticaulis sp.]|nr:hypothetical protein [Ponticaulis sp.]
MHAFEAGKEMAGIDQLERVRPEAGKAPTPVTTPPVFDHRGEDFEAVQARQLAQKLAALGLLTVDQGQATRGRFRPALWRLGGAPQPDQFSGQKKDETAQVIFQPQHMGHHVLHAAEEQTRTVMMGNGFALAVRRAGQARQIAAQTLRHVEGLSRERCAGVILVHHGEKYGVV